MGFTSVRFLLGGPRDPSKPLCRPDDFARQTPWRQKCHVTFPTVAWLRMAFRSGSAAAEGVQLRGDQLRGSQGCGVGLSLQCTPCSHLHPCELFLPALWRGRGQCSSPVSTGAAPCVASHQGGGGSSEGRRSDEAMQIGSTFKKPDTCLWRSLGQIRK